MNGYWEDVHFQYRMGLFDEVEFEAAKHEKPLDSVCTLRRRSHPEPRSGFGGNSSG